MGYRKSSAKGEFYSKTGLAQKPRKVTNKRSDSAPKRTRIKNKQSPKSVE